MGIAYRPYAQAWPGASVASKKGREPKEESVPKSCVEPLEEFECRKENVWQKQFKDDFYGAIKALKEGADDLFIETKDYDASLEYYSSAIDKLRDVRPSELKTVIFTPVDDTDEDEEDGPPKERYGLVLGNVKTVDAKTQTAFVAFDTADGSEKIVRAAFSSLIAIHESEMALQSSIYMNRARIWMQVDRSAEAEQDLSIVVTLWTNQEEGSARNEQLSKCHCLRAI